MCEQCVAHAETILQNIIPGFTLMRATVGSDSWPAGWYGMVQSNDPDFVFPGPLVFDSSAGLSDEELERFDFESTDYEAFVAAVNGLKEPLKSMHVMLGYELVTACLKAGYSIEADGTEVAYWLMSHMAKMVASLSASTLGQAQ